MHAEPPKTEPSWRRLVTASGLTIALSVLAWDLPRTLGAPAGLTTCALLAVSSGTLSALTMGRPRSHAVLAGAVALAVVAAACALSAHHVTTGAG